MPRNAHCNSWLAYLKMSNLTQATGFPGPPHIYLNSDKSDTSLDLYYYCFLVTTVSTYLSLLTLWVNMCASNSCAVANFSLHCEHVCRGASP